MKVVISQAKDESTDEESSLTTGGGQKNKKKVVILLQPLSIYLPTPIVVKKATFLIFF